jgi:hypothetical protein
MEEEGAARSPHPERDPRGTSRSELSRPNSPVSIRFIILIFILIK